MKDFLDWLLQQIGDAMLITATLAILRNIAKGWLEAYWPQNEEEKDETGTESESESESEGSTSTNTSISETDFDYQELINKLSMNGVNFARFLKERKYSKKIKLDTSDFAIVGYHSSLVKECLDHEIFEHEVQRIVFKAYFEQLKQCLMQQKMTRIKCVELMDQLQQVLEILLTYAS